MSDHLQLNVSIRRIVALCALASALLLLPVTRAFGHAIVERTEPGIDQVAEQPPRRVAMFFNEPVELAFGAIRVFDSNGRRVDSGEADHLSGRPDAIQVPLKPDLADGTYVVSWRVVSADGHAIKEAFVFHVGRAGAQPAGLLSQVLTGEGGAGALEAVLSGVARWIGFAAMLLLAGAAIFLVVVWRGTGAPMLTRPPEVEDAFSRRFRRIVVGFWLVLVVVTVAHLFLHGAVAANLPLREALSLDVMREVLRTKFGRVYLGRLVLLALAPLLWIALRRAAAVSLPSRRQVPVGASVGAASVRPALPGWLLVAGGLLSLAILATPGLAGHAGTTSPVALNVAADVVHMLAASAWLGGLVLLVAAAFPATRQLGDQERLEVMAPVVSRFSDMAMLAVAALVATGIYRSWVEVRALRALTGAPYGLALLTKLAAFLPILALGAVNNRWMKPRMDRAVRDRTGSTRALHTLRRLVAIEVALGVLVLGITAFLVNLPPARVDAGIEGPFIADVRLGDHNLNVVVDPNEVGQNLVHLTAKTPEGVPAEIEEMRVLFRMPSEGIGPLPAPGKRLAPGHFVVQGHQLSVPGQWSLEVIARIDEFSEARTTVTVRVNR